MIKKIIAITNQKGGVGKTTTAINLAASFGAIKRRVLLVDLDPQGNATIGSGVRREELNFTMADLLLELVTGDSVLRSTSFGYDILPASSSLTAAEVQLTKLARREYQLQRIFTALASSYDFVLIDCPPSLNILTVNALVAAQTVIIPVQCEYYALEGLAALLQTVEQIGVANSQLAIEGVLRTMFDGRNRLTQEVSAQLLKYFKAKLYQTVIPRNVRLAEAPSHGMPVLFHDRNSAGALAYLALASEIAKRNSL